ncbi:MAG: MerR family DNA-binding transcriptional regulator [Pseudomonadota bacterium]
MSELVTARLVLETISTMIPCEIHEAKEYYRIGDLAREFEVSLRTLRFYEDRGLLHPKRSGSTHLYTRKDRKRLKIILLIKSLGFSLVDIEEMLKLYDSDQNNDGPDTILGKFSQQLKVLESQKADIERAISDIEDATRRIQEIN